MRLVQAGAIALFSFVGFGCADFDTRITLSSHELTLLDAMSPLGTLPPSPGNAYADDSRAAALGRRLFFDPGLSATGGVSCAGCHDPANYFTDGRVRAIGRGKGPRNTPSILMAPHYPFLSWDGRKDSLWSQALGALLDEREHALSIDGVAKRVVEEHGDAYIAAFDSIPNFAEPNAAEKVFVSAGKSIEAYLRTITRLEPSPFDHYVAAVLSGDASGGGHLSDSAIRGLRAFLGQAGCIACHHGPLLSDREFHVLGLPPAFGAAEHDEGRARGIIRLDEDPYRCGSSFSQTRDCPTLRFLNRTDRANVGAFRTPSLRNVEKTAPYMHSGQLATLNEVVDHYRTLPHEPRLGKLDPLLHPFSSNIRTNDLVAFLRSLTSPAPRP